jgi:hypothetical protein
LSSLLRFFSDCASMSTALSRFGLGITVIGPVWFNKGVGSVMHQNIVLENVITFSLNIESITIIWMYSLNIQFEHKITSWNNGMLWIKQVGGTMNLC